MKRIHGIMPLMFMLVFLSASGFTQRALVNLRATPNVQQPTPAAGTSPLMTFLPVALGGFRGIMADSLWLRLTYLQDNGSYVEIMQLANWITTLVPYDSEIWSYQAWNMSFNISSLMHEPEDRWLWVTRGLSLLLHEAMQRSPNPTAIDLEIGRIFQHKIASGLDPTHAYYKQQLANEISILLPDGRLSDDYEHAHADTARKLNADFGLDVAAMRDTERLYGSLDWRLASTHALYWATHARDTADATLALQCDRMIYQSLGDLFRSGHLTIDSETQQFQTTPDLDRLAVCEAAYQAALRRHRLEDTAFGYIYFLKDAVRILNAHGREAVAHQTFDRLITTFPSNTVGITFEQIASAQPDRPD